MRVRGWFYILIAIHVAYLDVAVIFLIIEYICPQLEKYLKKDVFSDDNINIKHSFLAERLINTEADHAENIDRG